MAASSMKAIGVSDQKVKMMGRWKCIETVDDTYVDPACAATYGCYRLYGHLLPPLNRLEHLARRSVVIAFGRVRTWQSFRARASVLHSVLVEDRRRIRPAPSQRRSG